MGVPFWDPVTRGYEGADYPGTSAWDQLKLAGVQVPGVCSVLIVPKKKVEVKKVHGVDGGPTIERGHEAAKVTISVRLWTPSQWRLWQDLLQLIWRLPSRTTDELDKKIGINILNVEDQVAEALAIAQKKHGVQIEHPEAKVHGVSAIVLEGLAYAMTDGARLTTISALQFIAPAPATRKIVAPKKVELRQSFIDPRNAPKAPPSETDVGPAISVDPSSLISLP